MAGNERLICASADLCDGGNGVRFPHSGAVNGFVIRFLGKASAFVNRCPHMGTELDWQPGEFFEESGVFLVCSTHGALFEPGTGLCIAGPCCGASLEPLKVREEQGQVLLLEEEAGPIRQQDESS